MWKILDCTNRSESWNFNFRAAHAFGLVGAVLLGATVLSEYFAEQGSVGEFELEITSPMRVFYCSCICLIVITVIIGQFAYKRPEKSSYLVAYCALLTLLSICLFFGSIPAAGRVGSKHLGVPGLRKAMESYFEGDGNVKKWNNLQTKFECCGLDSYKDWQDVRFGRTSLKVPISCCRPSKRHNPLCGLNVLPHDDKADEKIYARGCHEVAFRSLKICMTLTCIFGFILSLGHMYLAVHSCHIVVNKTI